MIIGIDFSISSPGICIGDFDQCQSLHVITKRKNLKSQGMVRFHAHPDLNLINPSKIARFDAIVNQVTALMPDGCHDVFLEGFSFASKGLLFDIAECTGMLKHALWKSGHFLTIVPPTTLKKFATGSGRAKKNEMHQSFLTNFESNPLDLPALQPGTSPAADLVDAFFLWKYGTQSNLKPVL